MLKNIQIDKDKILNSANKESHRIKRLYSQLCESSTPINNIKYVSELKKSSKDTIIENIHTLYESPSEVSLDFLNCIVETFDVSENTLLEAKNSIDNCKLEDSHLTASLNAVSDTIVRKIKDINDPKMIKEEIKTKLCADRFKQCCMFESYLDRELEIMMYNINNSVEVVSDMELLVRKIKMSKTTEYISSYPQLLITNTNMIKILRVKTSGAVLDLVTCLPVEMAKKMVELRVSKSTKKSFMDLLVKQTKSISDGLREGEASKYTLYTEYMRKLNQAYNILSVSIDSKRIESIYEHLAEMQPDIIYGECCLEDIIAEMEEEIANITFEEDEDVVEESLENFTRLAMTYNKIMESKLTAKARDGIIKGANKVAYATQKGSHKIVATAKGGKRIDTALKKAIDPIDNLLSNTVNKIKEMDRKERTDRIVTGRYRITLGRLIHKFIIAVAAGTVIKTNPLMGAISILTAWAVNRHLDMKTRKAILTDLEGELKMVEEKIEDAKSDGNRKAKYELMRTKMKLEKDIEKIKYNLK